MGKFLLFLLMLILAAVIFIVAVLGNIVGGILRLFKGLFGGPGTTDSSSKSNSAYQQTDNASADGKIFKEEDREYVEFEEVDD